MASKCLLFLLVALVMATSAAPLDEFERLLEDLLVLEDLKDVRSEKRFGYGSMSGIVVDPLVSTMYNEMRHFDKYKWATFKIKERSTVVPDLHRDGDANLHDEADMEAWNNLVSKLDKNPRYILFDTHFTNKEGRKIEKIIFMLWCPTTAGTFDKMIYASTKDATKESFSGLSFEFQAKNYGEMEYGPIKEEVEKRSK